jgi:hypothetical protein
MGTVPLIFPPNWGGISDSLAALDWFYPADVPPPTAPLGTLIAGSLLSSSISRFPSSSSSIWYYFGVAVAPPLFCLAPEELAYEPCLRCAAYLFLMGGSLSSSAVASTPFYYFFLSRLELSSASKSSGTINGLAATVLFPISRSFCYWFLGEL